MMFNSYLTRTKLVSIMAGTVGLSAAWSLPAAAIEVSDSLQVNNRQSVAQAEVDSQNYDVPADAQAPVDAPSSAAPEAATSSISDAELEQFANTIPQLVAIEQAGQAQVFQAIDESGLERDRFYEIYDGLVQASPGAPTDAAVTTTEQSSFEMALSRIETIEQEIRAQQAGVIEASGIDPARFDQIMAAVLEDPELQLEVQELMTPPQ